MSRRSPPVRRYSHVMITDSATLFSTKMGNESRLCESVGTKNAGRCQTPQTAPRIRAAASGGRRRSRNGRANPRHPNSSPIGPGSVTRVRGSR
jgi:hypothetical protein